MTQNKSIKEHGVSNTDKTWHKGACHCEAVTFEVAAPRHVTITDCNCSICNKTGFQHLIVDAQDFRLLTGKDDITSYTFGSHTAKHTFCKHCGVKPFYTPRSHPDGISVNLRCVDQSGFEDIVFKPFDGQNWEKNIEGLLGTNS
ncbi:MAG: aldehyde-activating protein [Robiginitomaculum sp.]|nr:MAG: aldehyde-activating protein [Robiginitomaculum sp.]